MEDYMRKLALWHTKTFKPIMTHDELEPIMAKLGFVGLSVHSSASSSPVATSISVSPSSSYNNISWKEYYFTAGGSRNPWVTEPLPRPKLPYPRIDGLHHKTYGAFCDAVAFYIGKSNLADHFHVREGTLDPATAATTILPSACNSKINNNNNIGNSNSSAMDHRLVLLKDINHNIKGISSHTIVS
ncbi:uncharacterized protein LOC113286272 isoform X2 [Papaver somniferum]|uniref:uncharacterized protein LOC113286272 isoform X2 n=1 Tax=Papaver somniferum TaxID=3469 RepID=UPI000E704AE7|nr:uncharacterized protein LOC113286272 isoform X2 [Papaver somniferum]